MPIPMRNRNTTTATTATTTMMMMSMSSTTMTTTTTTTTSKNIVSVRVQPRSGKKFITIIEGLDEELDHSLILKAMKKSFQCNGSTTVDPKFGEIIQLSGDKRVDVYEFIIEQGLCERDEVVLHG